jgi:hypothetical protein
MKLFRILSAVILLLISSLVFSPSLSHAATFRSGETITVTESLKDLYISGGTVDVTSVTRNDLTAAGGTVRLEGDTTNDVIAAGGNVTLSGNVGDTARVAGGSIIIQSAIANDLVVAGGTIDLTNEASVGGDLVITGGTLRINAPVRGNVWVTGGTVEINSTVGGNVHGGEIGTLHLGSKAVITGDLTYTAEQKATLASGAQVLGKQNFKQEARGPSEKDATGAIAGIVTAGIIYKLLAGIAVAFFFIWLLPRFFANTNKIIVGDPLKTGFLGFAALILTPILSVILLVLFWIGIASFLLYFFLLVFSVIAVHIFTGWWILRWWYGRDKKDYALDWKAAVIGPLAITIFGLIPVIGWLINFILWLLGIGALVTQLWNFVSLNRYPAPAHNGNASHASRSPSKRKN